ncbi:phosphoribosylformylglycinamidine synthase subunit PurS [bacterium]|nr:phosphoribosylformylglycinamidine synthase subunit PurS [bacterium]MBU1936379.1 phosphoribosylformylglycinamidine synthase subunit PurS [bacterium]
MTVKIIVTHKPGVLDPQGQTVLKNLQQLGHKEVHDVRIGKYIEIDIDVATREEAEKKALEISDKMLANPVIESFRVEP